MNRLRYRLYRLQQRLAITRREAIAVMGLVGLLLLGAVRLYVLRRLPPPPPAARAARAFAAGTAALEAASADSTGTRPVVAAEDGRRINLNAATGAQLERLPRVGPVLAGRILAYRAAHGPFAGVEELERIRGIGPATVERLAPFVYVSPVPDSAATPP